MQLVVWNNNLRARFCTKSPHKNGVFTGRNIFRDMKFRLLEKSWTSKFGLTSRTRRNYSSTTFKLSKCFICVSKIGESSGARPSSKYRDSNRTSQRVRYYKFDLRKWFKFNKNVYFVRFVPSIKSDVHRRSEIWNSRRQSFEILKNRNCR